MSYYRFDFASLDEAFSPSREILDPEHFVGRRDEIKYGIRALTNVGGFLVIYGLRGVGKSSLAYQLKLIAEGHGLMPRRLNLVEYLPQRGFSFIVSFVRCDRFVRDVFDLISMIVFGDGTNESLFSMTKTGNRHVKSFEAKLNAKAEAKMPFLTIGGGSGLETNYTKKYTDSVVQEFRQLLGKVEKDNQDKNGLLILIDEFDIIEDKDGFASLVKACSSKFVKFGIIGIASTVTELIGDHQSVVRQIEPLEIPLMSKDELTRLLRRASEYVKGITFSERAIDFIAEKSEGFPYFAHLIGRAAMQRAVEKEMAREGGSVGAVVVTLVDVEATLDQFATMKLRSIYEEKYDVLIKNSHNRELLLQAFADQDGELIRSSEAYSLSSELGVKNPAGLMKAFTKIAEGRDSVLVKISKGVYRFSDPVFKVYCRIRNWKL